MIAMARPKSSVSRSEPDATTGTRRMPLFAALSLAAFAESLIPHGDFEEGADGPAFWGAPNPAKGIDYVREEDNRFARITAAGRFHMRCALWH